MLFKLLFSLLLAGTIGNTIVSADYGNTIEEETIVYEDGSVLEVISLPPDRVDEWLKENPEYNDENELKDSPEQLVRPMNVNNVEGIHPLSGSVWDFSNGRYNFEGRAERQRRIVSQRDFQGHSSYRLRVNNPGTNTIEFVISTRVLNRARRTVWPNGGAVIFTYSPSSANQRWHFYAQPTEAYPISFNGYVDVR